MRRRGFFLATVTTFFALQILFFAGCGGGGGGGVDRPVSDFLLFYGDSGGAGDGLFKVQDGALSLVKIINTGSRSEVQEITAYGDYAIFSACNASGCEPWITDGTSDGTVLLKDVNPGVGDSNPAGYILYDEEVFFTADDGDHGVELWKTDGTEAGTVMVKNIGIEDDPDSPTSGVSSNPTELTVFNGALYFVARDIDYKGYGKGVELWKTNGTAVGTVMVKNIAPEDSVDPDTPVDSFPHALIVFNGALYFAATNGSYDTVEYGIELWKTNGAVGNAAVVKDIGSTPDSSYDGSPEQFTVYNNELYFFADDGKNGFEPWKTDGTEVNTELVANINNTPSIPATPANLTYWTVFSGSLFFTADDGNGVELWETDGVSTAMLKDINPGAGSSVVANRDDVFRVFAGQLFFFANDGVNGFEPWVYDGTVAGPNLVKDIDTLGNSPGDASQLTFLADYLGKLYFTADDRTTGREIWVTEGTVFDTTLLKDIGPGFADGYSAAFAPKVLDRVLYFSADDGTAHGVEMWRTLGSEIETQMVDDLNPGAADGVLAPHLLLPL